MNKDLALCNIHNVQIIIKRLIYNVTFQDSDVARSNKYYKNVNEIIIYIQKKDIHH